MGSPAHARVAACVLALAMLVAAPSASARTFHAKPRAHGVYVFKVAKLRSLEVASAKLVRGHRRQRIDTDVVERAAVRGKLRVRPRGKLRRCRRIRCRIGLRVRTRKPVHPSATDPQAPAPTPGGGDGGHQRGPNVTSACQFGSFDVGNWPGACWRPYSDASPFNRRLPANPRIAANSDEVVRHIAGWGAPTPKYQARGADYAPDYEHPYYFSRPTDPEFTIHCVKDYGAGCGIEGMKIRIPDDAKAANADDGHMAVIDQATNWEYDFWQVRSKPRGGGRLDVSWGGRTRIGTPDALGLDGGGTASGFAHLAGVIRAPEVEALEIPHALFVVVKCDSGRTVYPADDDAGSPCSGKGEPNATAPAMGQHLQLDMTDEQIDALGAPPLQRAVLRAMARYGMFVGDTGGDPWNLYFESDNTYTSFGFEPQVRSAFQALGARHYADQTYNSWNIDTVPVDWARYLRVVDPCVSAGTC
jgi:hypothetical protein